MNELEKKWREKESKYWSIAIVNKYFTGPMKYLMENEEQARKAFEELSALIAKERAYEINDKQYTYVFESAHGGSTMVDLREVSTVSLQAPYHDIYYDA